MAMTEHMQEDDSDVRPGAFWAFMATILSLTAVSLGVIVFVLGV